MAIRIHRGWAYAYLSVLVVAAGSAILFSVAVPWPGGYWQLAWMVLTPMIFPAAALAVAPVRGRVATIVARTGLAASVLTIVGAVPLAMGLHFWQPFGEWLPLVCVGVWAYSMLAGLWALLSHLPEELRWPRRTAVFAGLLVATSWLVATASSGGGRVDRLGQMLVIPSTLLIMAIVVSLPALQRLRLPRWTDNSDGMLRTFVTLTCPRCERIQPIRRPGGKCEECGLNIRIDFDEPRCSCGYLLFGLTSDACPECGRSIRGKAWPATPASMDVASHD